MFKTTKEIYNVLNGKDGLKFFTEDREVSSEFWLQFRVNNGGSYRIRFISKDDDNDVSARLFPLLNVGENQMDRILPKLNELNNTYRHVKFCCDKDGNVNAEYDYSVNCVSPVTGAMEMIIRFMQIIDETYPLLMRALWA